MKQKDLSPGMTVAEASSAGQRVNAILGQRQGVIADQEHKLGTRAAYVILAVLCALCVLASLSGCLTAAKIGQWQRIVYSWGMDPGASKPCQVASAEASAYLANANRTLAEARSAFDLESDAQAKQLINTAAQACGKQ
uniref:Uncharacterized protein n=1 Tax=uncultured bacterium A1Q1_fos_25 TaxID=1256569 RepID=L7VXZ8_9BACT|nr:hypothetical protein [uncultured bacterium A1Q1_fos_25]